jgi:hypothetical protein
MTEMVGAVQVQADPMESDFPVPGTPEEEEVIIKKKIRLKLTENDLLGERGIERIYNDFPNKFKSRGAGHEVSVCDLCAFAQLISMCG